MGCCASAEKPKETTVIENVPEKEFLACLGAEKIAKDCRIIMAIDVMAGEEGDGSKHATLEPPNLNPYERALALSTDVLRQSRDGKVPLYFFGSREANEYKQSRGALPVGVAEVKNGSAQQLVDLYRGAVAKQTGEAMYDFRHLLYLAMKKIEESRQFTVLVVFFGGGTLRNVPSTKVCLERLANLPVSVVCVGIGDGDFSIMQELDKLEDRAVDNFHFMRMSDVLCKDGVRAQKAAFLHQAFMEVPAQYRAFKERIGYEPQ